jgi:hypothetical protein
MRAGLAGLPYWAAPRGAVTLQKSRLVWIEAPAGFARAAPSCPPHDRVRTEAGFSQSDAAAHRIYQAYRQPPECRNQLSEPSGKPWCLPARPELREWTDRYGNT